MTSRKAFQRPRSRAVNEVFEEFVAKLREDPDLGEKIAACMNSALAPGETINAAKLRQALFPTYESSAD